MIDYQRRRLVSNKMLIYRDKFNEIRIEGFVRFSIDTTYGEDADGNRAVIRTTVEEVEDIQAFNLDGDEITLTLIEIDQASDILTLKFLEG